MYPDDLNPESFATGMVVGANKGYQRGLAEGQAQGYDKGYEAGYKAGQTASGGGDGLHPMEDGSTALCIAIEAAALRDMQLCFCQTVDNGVAVDWGDGSPVETFPGIDEPVYPTHTYPSNGEYIINLLPADGCELMLGGGASVARTVFNDTTSTEAGCGVVLTKAIIGKNIPAIGRNAFYNCWHLDEVYVSDGVESLGQSCFRGCASLSRIRLPETLTGLADGYEFYNCYALSGISIPSKVEVVGQMIFGYCNALRAMSFENVTTLNNGVFQYCRGLQRVDLPETLTSIGSSVFSNTINLREIHIKAATPPTLTTTMALGYSNCAIYIPKGSLEAYSAADYWSRLVAKFVEE